MKHFTRGLLIALLALLVLPARAGVLSQQTTLTDPLGPFTQYYFGSTGVRISDDGLTFEVASPGIVFPIGNNDGTGAGYAFQYLNGAWNMPFGWAGAPPNGTGYGTGLALSADGSEFFLGFASGCPSFGMCGPAPVFADIIPVVFGSGISGSFLDPTSDPASEFGSTAAVSHDGTTLFIGAPNATTGSGTGLLQSVGKVFVYTYSGGA